MILGVWSKLRVKLARHSSSECFNLKHLFHFDWGENRRCATRMRKCHRRTVHLDGRASRLKDPNHFQSPTAIRQRLRLRFDAVTKMLTGQFWLFLMLEVREVTVSGLGRG